jgi:hypothetical protein
MNPNPYLPPVSQPALAAEPPVLAALAGDDGGMSVDFSIELDDILEFTVYHHIRSPLGRRFLLRRRLLIGFAVLLGLAAIAYLASVRGMFGDIIVPLVGFAVLGLAYVVFYPWLYSQRLRAAAKTLVSGGRNMAVFGPRRIMLTPQLVMHASPYTQSATRWVAVERIDAPPGAVYIYVSTNSAHVVPARAFSSADHYQTFVQTAQEYYSRALAAENHLLVAGPARP